MVGKSGRRAVIFLSLRGNQLCVGALLAVTLDPTRHRAHAAPLHVGRARRAAMRWSGGRMEGAVSSRSLRAQTSSSLNWNVVVVIAVALAGALLLGLTVDPSLAYLALAAIVAPVLFYYVLSRPILAVSVALASHAWAVELAGPYVTPFKIAGIVAILVVAADLIQRKRLQPMPRAFSVGVGALLMLVAVGELLAEYDVSFAPFFEFGGTLIIYILLSQTVVTLSDVRVLSRVYVVNLILTALSVWREVGWSALSEAGTRAVGICGQPNVLGNHLAMSVPFALAVLMDREQSARWRFAAFAAVLGSMYGEWAAASRGGTVGYVAGFMALAVWAPRRPVYRVTALFVALAAVAAFASFGPRSFARVTDTFDGTSDLETTTSERALHARIGADMLPRHPFLGHGITAFGYERSRYSGTLGGALHSSVLAVAVSYGLPALALYVLLQLSALVVAVRAFSSGSSRLYQACVAAAATAAMTSGLSGTELFRAEQWALIALCHILALRTRLAKESAATGLVPA
jgi:hypothetical protein